MVLFCFLYSYAIITGISASATWGPFESKAVAVKQCDKPTKPYMKNPLVVFHLELFNASDHVYLRGNATALRGDSTNLSVRCVLYRREDEEWKIVKTLSSVGCRGLIVTTSMVVLGMKYNMKSCNPEPGTYAFDKIDLNKLEHMWSSKREYGRFLWHIASQTPKSTIACYTLETIVTPLKHKPRLGKKTTSYL